MGERVWLAIAGRESWACRAAVLSAIVLAIGLAACGGEDDPQPGPRGEPSERPIEPSSTAPWSLLEDHRTLVRSGAERREETLKELQGLGVDTLRVPVKWNEVAPSPGERARPRFDATDPRVYPGFGEIDDLLIRATRRGFRILVDLAPDAPVWATRDRRRGTVNLRPQASEFAAFAGAVAKRYSGEYEGIPRVEWFSIWNEPNHRLFLKPAAEAPALYRAMVTAAVPRIRAEHDGAKILVGETAAVGRAGVAIGPREFLRRWLCLDDQLRATNAGECRGLQELDVDGYAHHPYGPTDRVPEKQDIVSLLVIRRLGAYLDRAAEAGRLPSRLPIYSTEFGLQSNPPDPSVSTTPKRHARLLNEKEELSYRYPRLRSYAQYLLYDDPPRPGPPNLTWSGFQTGLKFADGVAKPAYAAYRLPIVVHATPGGVRVWGRVRPGSERRTVQLERATSSGWIASGGRLRTDPDGYFEASRAARDTYRFRAFDAEGRRVGTSRAATPIR